MSRFSFRDLFLWLFLLSLPCVFLLPRALAYDCPSGICTSSISAVIQDYTVPTPVLTNPANNGCANTVRPTFGWTRPSPTPITGLNYYDFYLDSSSYCPAISDSTTPQDLTNCTVTRSSNDFTLIPKNDLTQGYHTWYVTAFSNVPLSSSSETRTFYLDSVTPFITLTDSDSISLDWDTRDSATIPVESNRYLSITANPSFSGTVETFANIQLVLTCPSGASGCTNQTASMNSTNGNWSFSFSNIIPDITYTAYLSATDAGCSTTSFPVFYVTYYVQTTPSPTPITPTPTPNEGKRLVCHITNSNLNPVSAMEIDESAYSSHTSHGDFDYEGPIANNGRPVTGAGDTWCFNKLFNITPTPSISTTPTPSRAPTRIITLPPTSATPIQFATPFATVTVFITPPPAPVPTPPLPSDLVPLRDKAAPFVISFTYLWLPIHLALAILAFGIIPINIPLFLLLLAFPRRTIYQTRPFSEINIFDTNKLDRVWHHTISDIAGHFSLPKSIPEKTLIKISLPFHHFDPDIVKPTDYPIRCFAPIRNEKKKIDLEKNRADFAKLRIIPLIIALIMSFSSVILYPSVPMVIYFVLSANYFYGEYIYPSQLQPKKQSSPRRPSHQTP